MQKLISALAIGGLLTSLAACSGGPDLPLIGDLPNPLAVFDSGPDRIADPLPLPNTPSAPTYNPPPLTAQPTYSPPPATGPGYGYTAPTPATPTYTTPPPSYPSGGAYPAPGGTTYPTATDPYAYPEPAPAPSGGGSTGSCGSGACGGGGAS